MARTAKTSTRGTTALAAKRKPGRPPGSKAVVKVAAKPVPKATRRIATSEPAAATVPKLSKQEQRNQVEKLEGRVGMQRAKNRDATREGEASAGRIEELEAQVAQLETAAAAKRASAG